MKRVICLALLGALHLNGYSQAFNQEKKVNGRQYAVGKFNKELLQSENYSSWFDANYDSYEPDGQILEKLKIEMPKYTIKLFMGTWCGDSRREVPRFYRILETIDFPMERLSSVALDIGPGRTKQSPGGEEEGLHIFRVPTIVIFNEGKEVGRIIEEPVVSIEEDLLQILKGDYQENYHGVSRVIGDMEKLGIEKFGKRKKNIARSIRPELENYMELHSYSRVLYAAGKLEQAHKILELNQLLFPEEPSVYFNLGVFLWNTYEDEKAEQQFEQALVMEQTKPSEEEKLKEKIAFVKENRKPRF